MAEVQKTSLAGESTAHFVQFIMMHQQQTLHALGAHPLSPAGAPPPNLNLAKAFIDQLGSILERTRGNLTPDEEGLLRKSLETLQAVYAQKTSGLV